MFFFITLSVGILIGYSITKYPIIKKLGFKSFLLYLDGSRNSPPIYLPSVSVPKDFLTKGTITYRTEKNLHEDSQVDLSTLPWIKDENDESKIVLFQPPFPNGAKTICITYEKEYVISELSIPADSWWPTLVSPLFKSVKRRPRCA